MGGVDGIFIDKYSKMINNNKAILYSDISKDNTPSIKIHQANDFKKIDDVKWVKAPKIIIHKNLIFYKN